MEPSKGYEFHFTVEPASGFGFMKNDADKLRMELVPYEFMEAAARAMSFGAKKYAPDNWRKCDDVTRYEGAILRHFYAYKKGELADAESGLHPLDHMAASLAMLIGVLRDKDRIKELDVADGICARRDALQDEQGRSKREGSQGATQNRAPVPVKKRSRRS